MALSQIGNVGSSEVILERNKTSIIPTKIIEERNFTMKEVNNETFLEVQNKRIEEEKNIGSLEEKNETSDMVEEFSVKRSYGLRKSTVKMLQELKVFHYEDTNTSYNSIIDEAIRALYYSKKQK